MQHRTLGNSKLSFAPIVLGGNVFGWTTDEKTSLSIISAFVERGFSAIDTADVYSVWVTGHRGGESESLRRLNTDHIDLYQAHCEDPAIELEETLEAFAELIDEGKVRTIGASNYSAPRLAEALAVSKAKGLPSFVSLQPNYSLVARSNFEGPLQQLCLKEGLGVIPYYVLAAGFLTGKYRQASDIEGRARAGTIARVFDQRGLAILAEMDTIAEQTRATVTQIALAWMLAQPGITAPIVSATSLAQLDEILGATEVRLDPDSIERLNQVSA
jgi:aryl-alcohol dehydrogenase-like predicted oxidoreductase